MPAYNSARYIDANVGRVLDFFDRAGIDGEVVVADDGSTDGTADAIRRDDRVRVLRLEHGGKGAAVRAGMAAATGDIRAFTDGDLPYGMEPLPLAIAYIQERRYHAVIGDRTLPGSAYESTGLLRTIVSELASFAFRTLVTGGIYDTQGDGSRWPATKPTARRSVDPASAAPCRWGGCSRCWRSCPWPAAPRPTPS